MIQKLYLIMLFFFTVGMAQAQSSLTLTATHFPGSGDTLRYSVAQLSSVGNYTQTGSNFTWNFGGLIPLSQGVRSYKPAFLTNYAFFFSFQDFGELIADQLPVGPFVIQDYYNFYRKQTNPINAYIIDGAGMTFSNIPVPSYYTDKDELYRLPISFPQYDSTTFRFSTPSTTLLPIVYSKTGYRITQVDGWGTITTPYGTAPCIRIVTTQYSRDSIKTAFLPLAINNYQRSYQWLTTTSKIPFLEVNGNLVGSNFTPTQVRYRDAFLNLTALQDQLEDGSFLKIYPNPVADELTIPIKMACFLNVHDAEGKCLYAEEISKVSEAYKLNVSKWPEGIYQITLSAPDKISHIKFIKQ